MSELKDSPVVDPTPAPVVDPTPSPVVDPTPAPVTPPAPTPAPAPHKTYMERLLEMEAALMQHVSVINQFRSLIQYISNLANQLVEEVTNLNDQMNAIYDLAEAGQPASRDNVNKNLRDKIENNMRKIISDRVTSGSLIKIDAVESDLDLIAYSTSAAPYAFRIVSSLEESEKKDVIGKKAGDFIKGVDAAQDKTILEVYKIVKKEEPKADAPKQS